MNKFKKTMSLIVAITLVITTLVAMDTATVQAAVKLNKKSASIYVGETVQLKLNGAKSVTWKSSNKKVATVTSAGKVKGIKKGSCTITATNKKTKKSYKCKITVKALNSFGLTSEQVYAYTGGTVICYEADEFKGVTYVIDGVKLKTDDYSIFNREGKTLVELNNILSEGEHTFAIQKKGYKTFTTTIVYEPLKIEGMFAYEPWAENGTLYLCCTPDLEGKEYTITVDGKEVQPSRVIGVNGDGVYVVWVDTTDLVPGEHKVTVTADGLPEGIATFEVGLSETIIRGPIIEDGAAFIGCNSKVQETDYVLKVDDQVVQPEFAGLNGDGDFIIRVNISELSEGTHTITVEAEGFATKTVEFSK